MKLILISIVILMLFPALVLAQANIDLAYSWLLQQPISDVSMASLTALATGKVDASRASLYTDFIRSQFHTSEKCWPKPSCSVQDTALAIIAESKIGIGFTDRSSQQLLKDVENWFIQKQTLAGLNGVWALQIVSSHDGTCSLKYQKRDEPESGTFDLAVSKGRISYGNCKDQTFFNLNSCLGTNLADKPSTRVEVSCAVHLPGAQISLIYIEGDTIYLVSEAGQNREILFINNGFFGNKLDTLYANWALKTANSKVNSLIWLKKNAENTIIDHALLYLATSDNAYINSLLSLRSNFGNFADREGEMEFDNGFGALAVQSSGQHGEVLDSVREWFGTRQRKSDGSWLGDAKTTALILYGAFAGGRLPEPSKCSNGIIDDGEECDGNNLNSKTCVSLGFTSGNLKCFASGTSKQCTFDTSSCTGNGTGGNGTGGDACSLSNLRWLNQEGVPIAQAVGHEAGRKKGDTVILSVNGNINCKDKSIVFDIFEDGFTPQPMGKTKPVLFNSKDGFAFTTWDPVWFDDNPLPLVEDDPEYFFKARAVNENNISLESPRLNVLRPPEIGTRQCNDNVDNDADNKIDWPNDPGCSNSTDNTEIDVCNPNWKCGAWIPGCSDRIDKQTRNCVDQNECGVSCNGNESCITERSCSECVPKWECTDWYD